MTFSTRAIGPSSQVFAIPELVALVCSDLERPDCARLMRVSSCLFNHAMPIVWGEVRGMAHLLKLLPGVTLERRSRNGRYSDPNELTEELVIHLPQSSSLGRLRLYAPFVRTLEVLELPHRFYKIEGNLSALHSTIPKSGLLPNLRYLTLTDTCETVNQDHVDWVSLFLCRTLQSVRVLSWYPSKRLWLPLDQFPSALSELMQKCPDLEVLEVSPRSTISQREPGVYIPSEGSRESRRLRSSTVPHWCPPSSSSYFQTLRQLTGSTAFLQPEVLSFIGSLPALESLILHDSISVASRTQPDLGPDTTFPALKYLELRHLDARLTMHLCGLKQLVGSLTSAKIHFPFSPKGEWNIVQCDPPQAAISALSLLAPHLTDLAIHLPSGPHKISLGHSTIEAFRRLSLRSLMFSDACLAPDVGWSDVLDALPKIEILRLRCNLKCQDLEIFSQRLPRLHHLEVQVIDFKTAEVSLEGDCPSKPIANGTPLCLASGLYIHDLENCNVLDRVARYLSTMWPRIMCVNREWETPANIRSIDALNDRMTTLQAIKCRTGHLAN